MLYKKVKGLLKNRYKSESSQFRRKFGVAIVAAENKINVI